MVCECSFPMIHMGKHGNITNKGRGTGKRMEGKHEEKKRNKLNFMRRSTEKKKEKLKTCFDNYGKGEKRRSNAVFHVYIALNT